MRYFVIWMLCILPLVGCNTDSAPSDVASVRRILYPETMRRVHGWLVGAGGRQTVLATFAGGDRIAEFDRDGRLVSNGPAAGAFPIDGTASGLRFRLLADGTLGFSALTLADGIEPGSLLGRYAFGKSIQARQVPVAPWSSGSWLTDELWLDSTGPLVWGERELRADDAVKWSLRREAQAAPAWSREEASVLASGGPLLVRTRDDAVAFYSWTKTGESASSIRALRLRTSDMAIVEADHEILAPVGQHVELNDVLSTESEASLVFGHGQGLKIFRFSLPALTPDPTFGVNGVVALPAAHGNDTLQGQVVVLDGAGYLVGGVARSTDDLERTVLWRLGHDGSFDSSFGIRTLSAGRSTFRGIQALGSEIFTLNESIEKNPWSFHRLSR